MRNGCGCCLPLFNSHRTEDEEEGSDFEEVKLQRVPSYGGNYFQFSSEDPKFRSRKQSSAKQSQIHRNSSNVSLQNKQNLFHMKQENMVAKSVTKVTNSDINLSNGHKMTLESRSSFYKNRYTSSAPDLRLCRSQTVQSSTLTNYRRYYSSQWSMASFNNGRPPDQATVTSGVVSSCYLPEDDLDTDHQLVRFLQLNDLTDILLETGRISQGKLLLQCDKWDFYAGSLRKKCSVYRCCTKAVTLLQYKDLSSATDRLHLLQNVQRLSKLLHPHLLTQYGVCPSLGGSVVLVLERTHRLVHLKNLLFWFKENNPTLMNQDLALFLACQICAGVTFLQDHDIVHKALCAETIYLSPDCSLKLGGVDIELLVVSRRRGAVRWWPVEQITNKTFTHQGVVWSIGVVMWEILSLGDIPYEYLKTDVQVIKYVKHGNRLLRPDICTSELYRTMKSCWKTKPSERLKVTELRESLDYFLTNNKHMTHLSEVLPDKDDYYEDDYI